MKKIFKLLDDADLNQIYKQEEYDKNFVEMLDSIESNPSMQEKYANWCESHKEQLLNLHSKQITDGNLIAIMNNLPLWMYYMYSVWDFNYKTRTITENELDKLINTL